MHRFFMCMRLLGYNTRFAHSEVHRHELQLVLHMCIFDIVSSDWAALAHAKCAQKRRKIFHVP
jgi:hypothetical protein